MTHWVYRWCMWMCEMYVNVCIACVCECVISRMSYIHAKETYIHTKETYIHTKNTNIQTKETIWSHIYICVCECVMLLMNVLICSNLPHLKRMSHIYDTSYPYARISCHIWIRHVTYEWVMSPVNTSCHIWMSHVTCEYVMQHAALGVRHMWIRHVTYAICVISHMSHTCDIFTCSNESYTWHIHMFEWVIRTAYSYGRAVWHIHIHSRYLPFR